MFLSKISVVNFKNFESAELSFSPKTNCFTGLNGAGKTNLLDAVYYLSFCKSYFNYNDNAAIKHETDFFMIKGIFDRLDRNEEITCSLKKSKKKLFKRNNKDYKKLSEHIGLLPLVIISPDDSNLITNGSEERRKFLDLVISQFDKDYLNILIGYNRTLLQRNKLLKNYVISKKIDKDTLQIYNEQLSKYGARIFNRRKNFITNLTPVFQKYYDFISGGNEKVSISYRSQIEDVDMLQRLTETYEKDLVLSYTSVGIHRDDLIFKIGDFPLSKTASQGQQKSFLISLKFAEFSFIHKISKLKPILLLDDIFDKFDKIRVQKIIELTNSDEFGQIFITDTDKIRLSKILTDSGTEYKFFEIVDGKLISA